MYSNTNAILSVVQYPFANLLFLFIFDNKNIYWFRHIPVVGFQNDTKWTGTGVQKTVKHTSE